MGIETGKKQIGWICTYVPEELIHAAGFNPIRLLPGSDNGEIDVGDLLPSSICPFTRQILGNIRSETYSNLEGIVIAQSCNAMLHLYNALKEDYGGFVYLMDVPRKQDQEAVSFFTEELESFLAFLNSSHRSVDSNDLIDSIILYNRKIKLIEQLLDNFFSFSDQQFYTGIHGMAEEASSITPTDFIEKAEVILNSNTTTRDKKWDGEPSILLTGGVASRNLFEMLERLARTAKFRLYPENCTGIRYLFRPPIDCSGLHTSDKKTILNRISFNYLSKPPCSRMLDYKIRVRFYNDLFEKLEVKAVIYHDLMFCDLCHYDYLLIKDLLKQREIPLLKIKTELGHEDSGQLKTRVEAFLEIIQ